MAQEINDALLEIGSEEIPAGYIDPALKQIEELAVKYFQNADISFGAVKTYATPRRLVLYVEKLAAKSEDKSEELLGPAVTASKDADGNWTPAASGFAAKNGVNPELLQVKNTEKGPRLCFVKKTKGEKTEKLLAQIFPEIIKNIYFPKTMVWEESGFKFARPVRSVLALYADKIIKFQISGVKSSNWTIGLHAVDNSKIKIKSPEEYFVKLKNKLVIADQNERRKALERSIDAAVKSVGSVVLDEVLLDEVNYLLEYPSAVLCSFDKRYLALPPEALTVCIKKSQKCFAVLDKNGAFSNYFIDVKNGDSQYEEIAREGYERVVAARLSDAEFFYNNDLKKGLEANVEKLKGVVFHKEIGTIYEKVGRLRSIASDINKTFNFGIDEKILGRAALLSKADLVSEMVFEYGELQGVMGKIYAQKAGENDDVALSLQQHYYPLTAGGELPQNKTALIISLADKLDTLAANFAIGLEPSGSADPYGLRRAAIGVVRMITVNLPDADFTEILKRIFEFLPEKVKANPKYSQGFDKLVNFLRLRIENILESDGYSTDEVKAVVNVSQKFQLKSLGNFKAKLKSLKDAKNRGNFAEVAAAFKRINNILTQAKKQNITLADNINQALLSHEAEQTLLAAYQKTKSETDAFAAGKEYGKVFDKVLEIKPAIDGFFEKVMVMDKDEEVKKNRILLLNAIANIFSSFMDFSALQ